MGKLSARSGKTAARAAFGSLSAQQPGVAVATGRTPCNALKELRAERRLVGTAGSGTGDACRRSSRKALLAESD
jgi:hypothetical protein